MNRAVLPTAAVTPSRVPPPGATFEAHADFALLDDRYEALTASGDAERLGSGWPDLGLGTLSLADLRTALLFEQRRHYWTSAAGWTITHPDGTKETLGASQDPDADWVELRTLTDEIRRRVTAGVGPRLSVWQGDLTTLAVDAIVNAANERMLGGGGVDGAIHRAAGPELLAACREVPEVRPGVRCPTGEARITPAFGLPARYVIHTVGPVWHGSRHGEDDLLASAYRSSLALAAEHGLESVAFPAISTGVYGFPAERAAGVAVRAVRDWQPPLPSRVLLVGFDVASAQILRAALDAVA